ncbi:MAG: nucleotidyltransferase family protein [Anaerolineae bacterium]|nr:nucleotidyltransferase family protein [Anaerolineae bacterium]
MAYNDIRAAQIEWSAESILDFLRQNRDTLRNMGVKKIGLFGSYVRGEQHSNSDIDLLFSMENMTFVRWMDVWNFLEDHFGSPVDLVPEQDLRIELRPLVLPEVRYVEGL